MDDGTALETERFCGRHAQRSPAAVDEDNAGVESELKSASSARAASPTTLGAGPTSAKEPAESDPLGRAQIRRVCGPATREKAAILCRWTKLDGKLLNYDVTDQLARREYRRRAAKRGATRSRLLCVAVVIGVESSSLARAGVSTRRRGLIRTSRHSWHWSCCH